MLNEDHLGAAVLALMYAGRQMTTVWGKYDLVIHISPCPRNYAYDRKATGGDTHLRKELDQKNTVSGENNGRAQRVIYIYIYIYIYI